MSALLSRRCCMVAIRSENSPMLIIASANSRGPKMRSMGSVLLRSIFVDTESERDRGVALRTQADGLKESVPRTIDNCRI
jgi:hypothetical protein